MTTHPLAYRGLRVSPLVRDVALSIMDRWRSIWPWGLRPGSSSAFGFAATCVALATLVHACIGMAQPETVVFAPYYAATLVAALMGGGRAGMLALVLGGVIAYWLFGQAEWSDAIFTLETVENLAMYGTSSLVILWAAVSYRDLLQRLRDEQNKRKLLNDELAHRLANTLANVQTIVSQSLTNDSELKGKINARLAALASTNDLLSRSDWQTASLRDIVIRALRPYDPSRVHLDGDDVQCSSQAVMVLALVVHELTTNAAKYGALSKPSGQIDISWQRVDDRLTIKWVESGNLAIIPPTRTGFGTKLLQSAVRSFHGHVETSFQPGGLVCAIFLNLPDTTRA